MNVFLYNPKFGMVVTGSGNRSFHEAHDGGRFGHHVAGRRHIFSRNIIQSFLFDNTTERAIIQTPKPFQQGTAPEPFCAVEWFYPSILMIKESVTTGSDFFGEIDYISEHQTH